MYLDDVIVFSRTHAEHARHLDAVLGLLRSAGISLKLMKSSFFQPRVHYLGHVMSPGKLSVAEAAAHTFKTFNFPRTLTQVRSFLGACNVYRRFVIRCTRGRVCSRVRIARGYCSITTDARISW